MVERESRDAPMGLARLAGLLYLLIMLTSLFAEGFVRDRLVVSGDGAATLRNIAGSEILWRWGFVAELINALCDTAMAALLFVLLRPAGFALSLTAAVFRAVYAAAMVANLGLLLVPLQHFGSGEGAALTTFALRLRLGDFQVALVLFGIHLILIGVLMMRSAILPRLLGAGLALAGACYVINSLVAFLSPATDAILFPWIMLPGFLSEGVLTFWLLIAGVNRTRWRAAVASPS